MVWNWNLGSYNDRWHCVLLSDKMQDPIFDILNQNTSDADELFGGLWPFMKHLLMLFLPIWIFLLIWAAGIDSIIAGFLAGLSITGVIIFEKLMLRRNISRDNDDNNVIK